MRNFNDFRGTKGRVVSSRSINEGVRMGGRSQGTTMVGGVYHNDEEFIHLHFGLSKQQANKIANQYDYADVLDNPSGLVVTFHNDEDVRMYETGCRDLNELKRSLWKDFQTQRLPGEKYMDDFEPNALCTSFSIEDADKINNADALWSVISDFINNSAADGDSTDGINVIDTATCECVLGSSAE